jgi:hypothetical protein
MSKVLRKAFVEIRNGYSSYEYKGAIVFAQHLSHKEHLDLDEIEQKALEKAKSYKIPTEESRLAELKKEGLWTDRDESSLVQERKYLEQLNTNKKNIKLPSVLESFLKQIKEAEKKLVALEFKKRELIGSTCESYASKIVNEQYIYKSLFKDNLFTIPLFDEDEFQNLEDDELSECVRIYNQNIDRCSDFNIKKITIQDFFQSCYSLCDDNIYSFYGKSIIDLTYFQIKLANYGRFYQNLLQNNDIKNFPDDIKNDPDQLRDYVEAIKNGKKMVNDQNGQATGFVGMTKKDAELMGVSNQVSNNLSKDLEHQLKHFKR